MMVKLIDILLIEDNEDHAELIRQTLEDKRIANTIIHFDNAEKALAYLNNSTSNLPGVVLLDLNLPGMSGHEFLVTIKSSDILKFIPVVVLTTSSGEKDRVTAYEHHVNSYLVKPIDAWQFEKMVADLGFYWALWNKPSTKVT
ncbi:MAG TPA: response regulator [Gammaproteobacteria bacterium]